MGKDKNHKKNSDESNSVKSRKHKESDDSSDSENESLKKKRRISKKSKEDSSSSSSTSSSTSSSSSSSSSESSSENEKTIKKKKVIKRKKCEESSSSTSNNSSSSEVDKKKRKKDRQKILTKRRKKCIPKRESSSSTVSTDMSELSESSDDLVSTNFSAELPSVKKEKQKRTSKKSKEGESTDIPLHLMEKSKAMAPMTKEEWEKKQSVVSRVYDESTGRHRLVRGDGEVLEEIVSKERHKAINQKATKGDGDYFQTKMSEKLKK